VSQGVFPLLPFGEFVFELLCDIRAGHIAGFQHIQLCLAHGVIDNRPVEEWVGVFFLNGFSTQNR